MITRLTWICDTPDDMKAKHPPENPRPPAHGGLLPTNYGPPLRVQCSGMVVYKLHLPDEMVRPCECHCHEGGE